jgi:hypothetical protein
MKKYVERMVQEHSDLVVRIQKLDNYLYGNGGINDLTKIESNKTQDSLLRNMVEFANKAIQLRSMKTYLLALECRLNNEGIYYEDGEYLERVAKIVETVKPEPEDNGGGC